MEVMSPYNPCIGCEYYNKPYWSVVSPCASCPRGFNTGANVPPTIATAATNVVISGRCPFCGGVMERNEMVEFMQYPPKYKYRCRGCGHVDYSYVYF